MGKIHPNELELARWSELGDRESTDGDAELAQHLRWCARCRSVVADHRWLQAEVAAALAGAADAATVPRPKWWAVQESLLTRQRRQVVGWQGSAVASVVLAVCLMLSISPVWGTSVIMAQTSPPEAIVATAPDVGDHLTSTSVALATPTPSIFKVQGVTPSPTPVLLLPPTPAQSETQAQ